MTPVIWILWGGAGDVGVATLEFADVVLGDEAVFCGGADYRDQHELLVTLLNLHEIWAARQMVRGVVSNVQ